MEISIFAYMRLKISLAPKNGYTKEKIEKHCSIRWGAVFCQINLDLSKHSIRLFSFFIN